MPAVAAKVLSEAMHGVWAAPFTDKMTSQVGTCGRRTAGFRGFAARGRFAGDPCSTIDSLPSRQDFVVIVCEGLSRNLNRSAPHEGGARELKALGGRIDKRDLMLPESDGYGPSHGRVSEQRSHLSSPLILDRHRYTTSDSKVYECACRERPIMALLLSYIVPYCQAGVSQ
jgi:hypothetical protein